MSYYPHDYHAGPKYCLCDRCLSNNNSYYSRRSQARGLSGRPNKRYTEGGKDGMEESYVKVAGQLRKIMIPMIEKLDGKTIRIFKRGYGYQNAQRVRNFAEKNSLQFRMYDGNGRTGMCNRTDGIAFKYVD